MHGKTSRLQFPCSFSRSGWRGKRDVRRWKSFRSGRTVDSSPRCAAGSGCRMSIHEVRPSADLAPYIDAYWWSDSDGAARIIPDGCADVIFDGREPFVVGTMTRPIE